MMLAETAQVVFDFIGWQRAADVVSLKFITPASEYEAMRFWGS